MENMSKPTATPSSKSKFLGPFKHLKSYFRQFYNRCTCNVDHIHRKHSPEPNVLDQMTLEEAMNCCTKNNHPTCEECHQIQEHLKYTQNEVLWYNCERGISVVNGMTLPSPPPTPLFHPDGDFLFQVIPPPLEFQDKYSNNSRPTSTLRHLNLNQSGDAGVFRTRSGTSIHASNGCEEFCNKAGTPISFSAYAKYTATSQQSRPKSRAGFSLNDSIYRNSGFCKITSLSFQKPKTTTPTGGSLQELSVTWKELPKSISLNINSGLVESMFVPSWSDKPLRKAPFFVAVSKVINWSAIDVRKERVASRKQKLHEMRKRILKDQKKIWSCRHQIGKLKRKLQPGQFAAFADAGSDVSDKFQMIHWLSERDSDVNSTGRYFDVDEKRLVAIKISPANPPLDTYERCRVKLEALKELNALKQLDHVNIIELISYFEHMEKIHLVFDACDHSLRCEISCASGGVSPKMVHGVMYQIVSGLEHCHKKSLLHRNLSPDTILVTVEGTIKISDFSKSMFLKGQQKLPPSLPGDIKYGAPELLAGDNAFGLSADIWSVGCILVELILGKLLWNGSTPEEQLLLIHKSVGPLLPQHVEAARISDNVFAGQRLQDYFPDNCDKVLSVIELCLEVDFCKRIACRGLLGHPFIKRGSRYSQHEQSESALPRMALWEMRPHTAPLEKASSDTLADTKDYPLEGDESLPQQKSRTKTAFKSLKVNAPFPQDPLKEKPDTTSPGVRSDSHPHHVLFQEITKEQLYGLGTKYFWKNLHEMATHQKSFSGTALQESSPILKKGNEIRKTEVRKPLESAMNHSNSDIVQLPACDCSESNDITQCIPNGPRSRIQYLISSIPNASWSTVQVFTDHLILSAKKNPKTFCAHVGQLVGVLLDQISDTKSKVAGPSIRILNNICEYNGSLFEPEAERIIESMLNKLGGPSFIEKESNDVLRSLTNALKPCKAILSLIKYGINHKVSAARQSAMLLIEHAVKQVDLISTFGLPGEQTSAQRRFTNSVFEIATKFLRDSNSQTRNAARGVYQLLMRHPGFWYLYQAAVSEEKRHWVNRLLDEIRRFPTIEKKNLKPALKTSCSSYQ